MRTATRGGVDRSHSSLRTLDCGAIDLIAQVMYYAARRSSYTEQEHAWRAADRPVVVASTLLLFMDITTQRKKQEMRIATYASNACDNVNLTSLPYELWS